MSSLSIKGTICRGDFSIPLEVNFPIGKISVIWGQSGSGKSSILRAISGLDKQENLSIYMGDQCWQLGHKSMPTWQRSFGLILQQPYLFPHLNVRQNLDLAYRFKQKYQLEDIVVDLQLQDILTRKVGELSGGERQRVAIAQALLRQTDVMLFDEPLVGLHHQSREYLLKLIKNLQQQYSLTLLYVTHEFKEVLQLAEFILLLDTQAEPQHFSGNIQQLLSNQEVYQRFGLPPAVFLKLKCMEYVAEYGLQHCLIGEQRLLVVDIDKELSKSAVEDASLYVSATDVSISLTMPQSSSILNVLQAVIKYLTPLQDYSVLLSLDVEGQLLLAVITRYSAERMQLEAGQTVYASIKASQLRLTKG